MTDRRAKCGECGGPILAEPLLMGLCPRCLLGAGTGARPSAPPPPVLPNLEIGQLLGRGGMGLVYAARLVGQDRPVAVKVLPVGHADDPVRAARFTAEGRTLSALDHPNIVTARAFGQAAGVLYLVMDRVDGPTLRSALADGPLPPGRAVDIATQVCDALAYAHGRGVLHRDVKPENILLDDGTTRARLADFGLATALMPGPADDVSLTSTRERPGTRDYMAPECRHGAVAADERADLFAVGVVLYEMLVGRPPVGHFARPGEVNPAARRLDPVVLRCLADDPNRRHASARALRDDLARASRPRPWPARTAMAAAATLAGTAAVWMAFPNRVQPLPAPTPKPTAVIHSSPVISAMPASPPPFPPVEPTSISPRSPSTPVPMVKQLDMGAIGLDIDAGR